MEARHKVKAEVACLEVERTSLLLEDRVTKDEVSSFQSQVSKDKAAMEEDYQKALELIFAYSYRCCMFKHNICGDQLEVPNGMPDSSDPLPLKFFVSPKCPQFQQPLRPQQPRRIKAKQQGGQRNSRGVVSLGILLEHLKFFFFFFFLFFFNFCN